MIKKVFQSAEYAPVVIFAFDRPKHLKRALRALSTNPEFNLSKLFIFCDGPKGSNHELTVNETRIIANEWFHPNKTVVEAKTNRGLSASVIAGVTEIVETYGTVIVVEDDLEVDRGFLSYLNNGLNEYKYVPKVMQISAYMFPIPDFIEKSETLFLPNISSWGWATWSHAWANFDPDALGWELLLNNKDIRREFDVGGSYPYSDMLFRQKMGIIDSWAIRWNWSVYRCSGVVVYPPVSLVKNIGFDGSGTHCDVLYLEDANLIPRLMPLEFSKDIKLAEVDLIRIKTSLKTLRGPLYLRVLKLLLNTLRRIKLKYIR